MQVEVEGVAPDGELPVGALAQLAREEGAEVVEGRPGEREGLGDRGTGLGAGARREGEDPVGEEPAAPSATWSAVSVKTRGGRPSVACASVRNRGVAASRAASATPRSSAGRSARAIRLKNAVRRWVTWNSGFRSCGRSRSNRAVVTRSSFRIAVWSISSARTVVSHSSNARDIALSAATATRASARV